LFHDVGFVLLGRNGFKFLLTLKLIHFQLLLQLLLLFYFLLSDAQIPLQVYEEIGLGNQFQPLF